MDQIIYYSGIFLWVIVTIFLIQLLLGRWLNILQWIPIKKWWLKLSVAYFVGVNLMNSTKKIFKEIEKKDIKTDTLAELVVNIFKRLTFVGVIGVLLAAIPIWLLSNQNGLLRRQNDKIDIQNERINLQNNLIEAGRRGSLIILMSNIMDQMNEEIRTQKVREESKRDSIRYVLSEPLIGRIAALSQGFLPYRYLEGDTLNEREVSPERGQLLLSIVKSNLAASTYRKIYEASNFSYAYLVGADLSHGNLAYANLQHADLRGANLEYGYLEEINLKDADLRKANLYHTELYSGDLDNANLSEAYLVEAKLNMCSFVNARLENAKLNKAKSAFAIFHGANLKKARCDRVNFNSADFKGTNLDSASFQRANFTNAHLYDVNMSNSWLIKCDFSFAWIDKTNLTAANMLESNMSNTGLREVDFKSVKNLTQKQLLSARYLFQTKNLDENIYKQLKEEQPCLFIERGCN